MCKFSFSDLIGNTVKLKSTSSEGKVTVNKVEGLEGVCSMYVNERGSYVQFDLEGSALWVNGLEPGKSEVSMNVSPEKAESMLSKRPFAFISKCNFDRNGNTFEVKDRKFKSKEDMVKALEFLGLVERTSLEANAVLAEAKRKNRATSGFGIMLVEHKESGKVVVLDGYNKKITEYSNPRIKVISPDDRDGEIQISPVYAEGISSHLEIGTRYHKTSIYGGTSGINGQKKGCLTVVEHMDPKWDIICYDTAKSEHQLNGLFLMGIGQEAESGGAIYTDLMLALKGPEYLAYCSNWEDDEMGNMLKGIQSHLDDSDLKDVTLGRGPVEDGNPRRQMRALEASIRTKLKLGKNTDTNSVVLTAAKLGQDISLNPLLTDRFTLFQIGEEGTRASKFRRRMPNGIEVEMVLSDPEAWPTCPKLEGRDIHLMFTSSDSLICLCSPDIWPEVKAYTGGSDFDDRWLLDLFKLSNKVKRTLGLNTLYSGWLFRQPDGPGDGVHVDVTFSGYRAITDGAESPLDLFADIPQGKKADSMFLEIHERIYKVRRLVDSLDSLEKLVIVDKRPSPFIYNESHVDQSKYYRELKTLGNFKLKAIKAKGLDNLGDDNLGGVFGHEADQVNVGMLTNLNSVILAAFLDGHTSVYLECYLARVLSKGLLEICIDQQMGKADPEQVILLNETYYMGKNNVEHVEMAHIFGKSKEHKPRFSSIKGIYLPAIVGKFFHKDFVWPARKVFGVDEELSAELKASVIAISKEEVMVTRKGDKTFFSDLGKIAVAKACGLNVYKGALHEFYEGIHESFYSARVSGRAVALKFQIRWFNEFVDGRSAEEVSNIASKMISSDKENFALVNDVIDITRRSGNLDVKAGRITEYLKLRVDGKDYSKFFRHLVLCDLFQMTSKNGVCKNGLTSNSKFKGWIGKARRFLTTLEVLHTASKRRVHPSEVETCTKEALEIHESGVLHVGPVDSGYDVDVSKMGALRTLSYIPKGKVIEFVGGTAVRDSSFTLGGKTFIEWYISSFNDVAKSLNGGN